MATIQEIQDIESLAKAHATKEITRLHNEKRDLITQLESITIMVGEMTDLTVGQHDIFSGARWLLSEHGLDI